MGWYELLIAGATGFTVGWVFGRYIMALRFLSELEEEEVDNANL